MLNPYRLPTCQNRMLYSYMLLTCQNRMLDHYRLLTGQSVLRFDKKKSYRPPLTTVRFCLGSELNDIIKVNCD